MTKPMTRAACGCGVLAGLIGAILSGPVALAQDPAAPRKKVFAPIVQVAAAKPGVANLALKKVVLFNSGVGFFEHNGQVTDDAQVDMKFRTDDINDLLKSMVVQDLGGGQVSTVSYGSKDPISKTLKSFAIDLTTNPSLGQPLAQDRGEKKDLLDLSMPRAAIADYLGLTTETTSRTLTGFAKAGLISSKINKIRILDEETLRRISEGFHSA